MRYPSSSRTPTTTRRPRIARDRRASLECLEPRALLSVGAGPGEDGVATILWQGQNRPVSPGRWIVAMDGLQGNASQQLTTAAQKIQQRTAGPAVTTLRSLNTRSLLIETGTGVTYDELKASLSGLPGFRYVEPDFIVSATTTTPNDPNFSSLYGLSNASQTGGLQDADIDAPEAWDLTTGSSSIVVGIIDSGVDYNHPDLAANMWRNPGEVPGDGVDNDGNGYKDDVYGYDFINNDGDPFDDNSHGTHVAGTIGAVGNNGVGVAGINWQSKIMALKFLGANGSGPISSAVSALNYATMMRNNYGVNIRLTNNSWGGGAYSQAMNDAIVASGNAGMLFVVAAGNNASNNDTTAYYPASYNQPNVIVVAATDSKDVLASFSNYGAASVDLAAPGVSILSTTPNNTYSSFSGTSMAAPHVSGVAALAWSLKPTATYQQIRDAIYAGVDAVPALSGVTATGGRLNALNTLNILLGDAGDTLATARGTGLSSPGGRHAVPNAALGDGPSAGRDVDLYSFTAPAGSTLVATTSQPTGGAAMDTILRLFDAAGTELAVNDNAVGSYSRLGYTFATSGTYYIGVSGAPNSAYSPVTGAGTAPGSTGNYRLDLGLDVGDGLTSAVNTGLAVGTRYAAPDTSIGDGPLGDRDVDLYRFTAAAGTVLTAATSRPSGGAAMDTVVRLFDSAGNPLATADSAVNPYSRLNYTFTAAGTYYLGVSGSGNAAYNPAAGTGNAPGSTGDYRLDLSLAVYSPAEFDLGSLVGGDGSAGFTVSGLANYSELTSPSSYQPVGDVNQDGYDDVLFGAPGDVGATSMTIGEAYLIFGRAGGFPAEVDLRYLDGTNGYRIEGITLGDRLGFSGGGAGDLNGDGAPDLALGAIWGNPSPDRLKAGQTFVLYGGTTHLAALDLADGTQDGHIALATLTGTHGFVINGIAADDNTGRASGAGDVNNDGIDDLVIGSIGAGASSAAYVVYGRTSAFPAAFELSTLNGTNGFVIPALGTTDGLGIAVAGVGDVNQDGIDDFAVGAYTASPSGRTSAGQGYVIFGRSSFPASFNLATLNGATGFTVNGALESDLFGYVVAAAGDVNGDGIDDVAFGAIGVDSPVGLSVGAAHVVFGRPGAFPATIEVSALDGLNGFTLRGSVAGGSAGRTVGGVGDTNGDGYDDLIVGVPYASPNGISSAGQSFVVYGGPSFEAALDLAGLLAANGGDGSLGFVLNGYVSNGRGTVSGVGDINGDGLADLRVGAPYGNTNGLTAPGQGFVVFGQPSNPAIRVMPPSGLITSEAGATARFTVSLTARPTADVTISVGTSDASEGTVSTSSLTFTPANWNVPQTVTVTGVNDGFADGDIAYTIVLGAASSADSTFNGMDPVNVSVTNIDNDLATTTFTKTENKNIPDRGTYTSSLAVAPTGTILDLNVRVNITHGWDEDLDVTLIAPDGTRIELFTDIGGSGVNFTNTVLDDEATVLITSGAAPFTGTYRPEGNLTALEGKGLAGTWKLEVKDDAFLIAGKLIDWAITARYSSAAATPQAIVTPTTGLVTTEGGGTASFTVRLDNAPTADVTIPISSSDSSEGLTSVSSLTFTPANWSVPQTVTVTGVDDAIVDGAVAYTIILGASTSTDPDFNGLNPTDVGVTNNDNDVPPTKFYVVDDGSPDRTFEYAAAGGSVENYAINGGNSAPRGAASTAAGDRLWVVDANKNVYVYNTGGTLLGSWTAGTLASNATVEGIATDGTDIWIVDARQDRVYRYTNAASRLSGSQTAASNFALNSGNTGPKDVVTDGTSLWVVNDASTDKVFKYNLSGTLLGSWTISGAGSTPTGITLDPSGGGTLWIVDNGSDRVYQFDNARSRTSGSQSPATSFALAAGNTNPQGIADPPSGGRLPAVTPSRVVSPAPTWPAVVSAQVARPVPLLILPPDGDGTPFAGQTPAGPLSLRSRFSTRRHRP